MDDYNPNGFKCIFGTMPSDCPNCNTSLENVEGAVTTTVNNIEEVNLQMYCKNCKIVFWKELY